MYSTSKRILVALSSHIPSLKPLDYLLSLPYFLKANKRFPFLSNSEDFSFNDFIFSKMINNRWSALERACCDKEYAKIVARGLDNKVKIPKALCIIIINSGTTADEIYKSIVPFAGVKCIAKPAHSSGQPLFLNKRITFDEVGKFLAHAKLDYFHTARETQYKGLQKKIIVEQLIEENITDYKFFCAGGKPLFCQIDIDRYVGHKRVVVSVPDFLPMKVQLGNHPHINEIAVPDDLAGMLDIVEALAAPFDFVRLDLYHTNAGTYFSEFTFTPGAAADRFSDKAFERTFYQRIEEKLGSRSLQFVP